MTKILIRNGHVIDTEPAPYVRASTDVLIDGGVIVAVGTALPADGAEVIDATRRIVLPGLVDTHRHTWQAALRSAAPDATLADYFRDVIDRFAPRFRPEDVYAGNLAGALECLDAGITTLLDWSHNQRSPAHTDAAVQALRDSGIRALFGYAHPGTADRRPDEVRRIRPDVLAAWGLPYASLEDTEADWRLARELGCRISVHVTGVGPIEQLHERGLLGPDTNYVHCNGIPDEAVKMLADSGGSASVTPAVEAQMGFGLPETGRLRRFGVTTALGVDTVTAVPGDMFSVMRAALALGRMEGEPLTAADVLGMATLGGATALGMADLAGSLRPGKQADIILLRTDTPGMSATQDPIGAVVTAAGVRDVDTVLVGGTIVKRDGRLVSTVAAGLSDLIEASARHLRHE
jgi:cytosine/adenosine deaminase-related metal-dependent hydrolase